MSLGAPLAETLERLDALDPWLRASIGEPVGDGWCRVSEITAEQLAGWVDDLATRHGGRRDVAGSYLTGWLASTTIIVPTAAVVLERRLPVPDGDLWFHRHDDGWFDQVAFERTDVYVTPMDAAGDHPDVIAVSDTELTHLLAQGLVTRLDPILEAIRALAPFGRRGLWGIVTDEFASAALWAARAGGADMIGAWRLAETAIDFVAEERHWLRARPRPFTIPTAQGPTTFSVRGTCCLYYKTQLQPPDPFGEGYCTTCPFRDDDSRRDRFLACRNAVQKPPSTTSATELQPLQTPGVPLPKAQ